MSCLLFRWTKSLALAAGTVTTTLCLAAASRAEPAAIEDGLIFQASPDAGGTSHADNEINFIGRWKPKSDGPSGSNSFYWWLQNATTLGSVTTGDFQEILGILSPPDGGDTGPEQSITRLQHLAWEWKPEGDRFRLEIGKLTTRVLLNQNRYAAGDREDFFTPMVVNNPVTPYTARAGLGAFTQVRSDDWYLSLFVRAPDTEDWISFDALGRGDSEYAAEFALTPNIAGIGSGNYRFTYHYSEDIPTLLQPAGGNIALSFDQDLGTQYGAFFRYTYADNAFRAFKQRLAAGFQKKGVFRWPDDRLGLAFWWGDTKVANFDDELGLEVFWRMQMTRTLQVSPDLQVIFNPAKSDDEVVTIFGLRARTLF